MSSAISDLCLACSGQPFREANTLFLTICCGRPICANCLRSNPRLARYVPCLACLGGVRAVAGPSMAEESSQKKSGKDSVVRKVREDNLDGALRDTDVFAIGDEDEEEEEDSQDQISRIPSPPPAYHESESAIPDSAHTIASIEPSSSPAPQTEPEQDTNSSNPRKHYIQKADTLRGLALRYGVDGRALCKLNNLPPTTLSTTPHLLHTRAVLLLPPSTSAIPASAKPATPSASSSRRDQERERELELERSAKRLQLIAKEEDWRVARTYAVLAQSPTPSSSNYSPSPPYFYKTPWDAEKSEKLPRVELDEGSRALDAYLEDDAWEARERAAGRGPSSAFGSATGPSRRWR